MVIQGPPPGATAFSAPVSLKMGSARGVGMASRLSAGAREPQAPEWMSLQRAALRLK